MDIINIVPTGWAAKMVGDWRVAMLVEGWLAKLMGGWLDKLEGEDGWLSC